MIQSMTGFGSAERKGCRVEMRSLNSRFLDIYIKAPSFLNPQDIEFRAMVKERFSRGKIDITVSFSWEGGIDFKVNSPLVGRLCDTFRSLQKEFSIPGELDISTIAGFHDLFLESDMRYDVGIVKEVFSEALDGLGEMRCREGVIISGGLESHLEALDGMNVRMRELCRRPVTDLADRIGERLKAVFGGREVEEARLLQEAALIASRIDITEESARIDSHLRQSREILRNGDIVGRKLDFVVQELHREVNTIASKSADFGVSGLAVDMKAEIEKIREQVQNIQ